MDVSVIIVNYNTKDLTLACIESVMEKTSGIDYEILLVDNASTDGSRELFERDNRISYLYLEQNLGFGKANNKAVDIAKGRNVLFLNSDTLLVNNAIKILSDYLDENEKVGACGGNLFTEEMAPAQSYEAWAPSMLTAVNGFLRDIPSKIFAGKSARFNHTKAPKNVAYITGADLMVKQSVLQQVGGAFDPRFFMYYEDTELCYRIKKNGFLIQSVPSAEIIHLAGRSAKSNKSKKAQVSESRDIYFSLTGRRPWYSAVCRFFSNLTF